MKNKNFGFLLAELILTIIAAALSLVWLIYYIRKEITSGTPTEDIALSVILGLALGVILAIGFEHIKKRISRKRGDDHEE